jgi:SAM-dependent methyltransferase
MDRGPRAVAQALEIADLVVSCLAGAGRELADGDVVLDFGSSSGRIISPLSAWRPDVEWIGCDPNGPAIEWAQEHVGGGRFFVSDQRPPLALGDASVDVAFAISIWSHYAESAAREWLDEMHRVIRPGGMMLLTTHGAYSLELYQRVHRETDGRFGLSDEHILEAQRALAARGSWWFDSFGAEGDWGVQATTWGHAHYLPE